MILVSSLTFMIIFSSCVGAESHSPECEQFPSDLKDAIQNVWHHWKQYYASKIDESFNQGDPYILYNVQAMNNNLVKYAEYCKDYELLSELAELFLVPYKHLKTLNGYSVWLCESEACDAWYMDFYKNNEVHLVSSQYIYLLSDTMNAIAGVPADKRTPKMKEFANKYLPVIMDHHLHRWVMGDGGNKLFPLGYGYYTHKEFMQKKLDMEIDYAEGNRVTDRDMWTFAAAAEMFDANRKDPSLVPITTSRREQYMEYFDIVSTLLQDRLDDKQWTDFEGNPVKAFDFGLNKWDISHARRFVHVFMTLYDSRNATNQSFPSDAVMEKLANELAYGIFNKDFDKPLFHNYFDGSNDVYRQGDSIYDPYRLSSAVPNGGYCFWGRFNDDVKKICEATWNMLKQLYVDDVSGNMNDGKLFDPDNKENIPVSVDGKFGRALSFNGNGDYVKIPDNDLLDSPNITGEISVAMWIYCDGQQADFTKPLSKDKTVGRYPFRVDFRDQSDNNKIWFGLSDGQIDSSGDIPLNTWVHVAGTYNGTELAIYINGIKNNSVTGSFTIDVTDGDIGIGGRATINKPRGDYHFKGYIDDVFIFNRSLSESEIFDIFSNNITISDGLVGHWNFDTEVNREAIQNILDYYIKPSPWKYYKHESYTLNSFLPSMVYMFGGISHLSADINNDGSVDISDMAELSLMFGKYASSEQWNENLDLVKDDEINIYDLVYIGIRFTS